VTTKRTKELKNLSKDELASRLRETQAALFDARMKQATGQLTNTASLWKFRKDIARIKTLETLAASGTAGAKKTQAAPAASAATKGTR
jgi:large subunit ribosomal protein L29